MAARSGRAEVGDRKKQLQLVGAKAQLRAARKYVEQIRAAFPMRERLACGLLGILPCRVAASVRAPGSASACRACRWLNWRWRIRAMARHAIVRFVPPGEALQAQTRRA